MMGQRPALSKVATGNGDKTGGLVSATVRISLSQFASQPKYSEIKRSGTSVVPLTRRGATGKVSSASPIRTLVLPMVM